MAKTALPRTATAKVQASIAALASRQSKRLTCGLTLPELQALLIKPEHVKTLTEVFDLVGLNTNDSHMIRTPAANVGITIKWATKDKKFLIPRYAQTDGLVDNPPEEALAKWDKMVQRRLKIGRDFGMARAAFDTLNERCTRPELVYFMPSIVGLCMLDKDTEALAETLRTAKAPSNMPNLPFDLRVAAEEAEVTFAKALVLEPIADQVVEKVMMAVVPAGESGTRTSWGAWAPFI